MTETMKTAIITIILIATALSGCLDGSDTAKEDETLEHMVQLEAILTDPEISEEEKIAAYTLAHEAITGEKHELNPEADVTQVEIERKIVGVTVSQGSSDIIAGIGEVLVTIQGGENYDQLKEIEVFVNNISLGTYLPKYQTEYKIECNIVGKWNVRVDGAFTDGTIQTLINTSGFELRELKDVPDAGALGERYIGPSNGMSREDAKKFCEENGIIWGCDDNPTSKPTLTSTKVTPIVMPTVVTTPEPEPELPDYYISKLVIAVDKLQWDDSIITFAMALSSDHRYVNDNIKNIKFYVDGELVATIKPTNQVYPLTYHHQFTDSRREFRNPMLIKLPPGTTSNGEITAILSVYNMDLGVEDGEYPYRIEVRTPPEQYKEKYNAYPYNTDWL